MRRWVKTSSIGLAVLLAVCLSQHHHGHTHDHFDEEGHSDEPAHYKYSRQANQAPPAKTAPTPPATVS